MDFKELAKGALNAVAGEYIKKIKLVLMLAGLGLGLFFVLMATLGGGVAAEGGDSGSVGGGTASGTSSASTSEWDQFLRELHAWEDDALETYNIDGVECYVVKPDGGGGAAVGYGVDIGAHGAALRNAGHDTSIGSYIPVDIVDEIEVNERDTCYTYMVNNTKAKGLELTQYQLYALTSRGFNCGYETAIYYTPKKGNIDFLNGYKEYWKDGDDMFEDKVTNGDYSHELYVNCMAYPVSTAENSYVPGLEARRKAEWTLFQAGYYTRIQEFYIGESGMLGQLTGEFNADIANTARAYAENLIRERWTYDYMNPPKSDWQHPLADASGNPTSYRKVLTSNGLKTISCATFQCDVLYHAGILREGATTVWVATYFGYAQKRLADRGVQLTQIHDYTQVQPGDLIYYTGEPHVAIVIDVKQEDGKWYFRKTGSPEIQYGILESKINYHSTYYTGYMPLEGLQNWMVGRVTGITWK